MTQKPNHHWHMRRALRLAKKAEGWTKPNPLVGAILMHGEERIGEGIHERLGEAHAEVNAIHDAIKNGHQDKLKDSTLYVTLEPCSHTGKTGPCTQAIIEAGISKVVIATVDPNPQVQGQGIKELEAAGTDVITGINEEEAQEMNRHFFTYHEKQRPWITLKVAISLDGTVGYPWEQSKLTGKKVQKQVHIMRHKHHAILIGSGTLHTDDPHLGVREIEGQDPIRIILKGERELPKDSQIFRDEKVIIIDESDISIVMKELHQKGIQSVLVEGGPSVFTSFLKAQYVDEINVFIAAQLFGEKGLQWNHLEERVSLELKSMQKWGQDIQLVLTPKWDSHNS